MLSEKISELQVNTVKMLSTTEEVDKINLNGVKVIGDLKEKNNLNESAIVRIEECYTRITQ